jgi:putative spermidine/putrescine transport system permease protein
VTTQDATQRAVRKAVAREQRLMLAIASPALLVMIVLLVLPVLWLVGLSFFEKGSFSFANYERIASDSFYARSFWLTLWIALIVTACTGVIGYVLAYAFTLLPRWLAALGLAMVALPFWTSVLVRTYAWLVLLQNRGVVNKFLKDDLGVIDQPLRLMHNVTGTTIGMVHILLPFMVFPIYAALQRIDRDYMRAAHVFGASPVYAFWRVHFPLARTGLAAGVILVFVLSLGFFVTPSLLGGGRTMMMSLVIYRDVSLSLDWGPASAIATLFVIAVLAIFAIGTRLVSLDRLFQR